MARIKLDRLDLKKATTLLTGIALATVMGTGLAGAHVAKGKSHGCKARDEKGNYAERKLESPGHKRIRVCTTRG